MRLKSFAEILEDLDASQPGRPLPPAPAESQPPPRDSLYLSVQGQKALAAAVPQHVSPPQACGMKCQTDPQGNRIRISDRGSALAGPHAENVAWETGRREPPGKD